MHQQGERCVSMQAVAWAFSLGDVTPLAKLAAIYLGESHEIHASPPKLDHLMKFCCAGEAEIREAIDELSELLDCKIDDNRIVSFTFPVSASFSVAGPSPSKSPFQIYVIAGRECIKIGISRDVRSRLRSLQSWTPEQLYLVWWAVGPRYLIRETETAAHAVLSDYRIAGEWFSVTAERAISVGTAELSRRGIIAGPRNCRTAIGA